LRKKKVLVIVWVLFTLSAFSRPGPAYPADPENAALLYYQAFLTLPEAKEPVGTQLREYARGEIELNKAVEDYVASCRAAIELAVVASELRQCDWGMRFSEGFDMLLAHLGQTRALAYVLLAEAQIQLAKGNYELALERCVTSLQMSRHVGDDTLISFLVAVAIEMMADNCIADLLGKMPADSKVLEQLKAELASQAKKAPSALRPLDFEREIAVEQIRMDRIGDLIRVLDVKKSEKEVLEEVWKLGGEAFLKKSRDHYSEYMHSAISILRSGAPYAQTHQQLTELAGKLPKEPNAEKNPEAIFTTAVAPSVSKIYGNMIRGRTQANALRTAVEVYMVKAKTGRLPEKLPAGVPKDLFSEQDFEYKKTRGGFVLRCRAKDLNKNEIHQYEFKVLK
jgi:hypothetical protein